MTMGEVPEGAEPANWSLYRLLDFVKKKWIPKYKKSGFYAKPWWTQACSRMWHERDYRRFKETGQMEDKIAWKRARALTKKIFKEAKRQS